MVEVKGQRQLSGHTTGKGPSAGVRGGMWRGERDLSDSLLRAGGRVGAKFGLDPALILVLHLVVRHGLGGLDVPLLELILVNHAILIVITRLPVRGLGNLRTWG